MSSFSVAQLSQLLGCQLPGPADLEIHGVSTIEKAGAGEITFLANMKYAPKVKGCQASAIIAAGPNKDFSGATLVSSTETGAGDSSAGLYCEDGGDWDESVDWAVRGGGRAGDDWCECDAASACGDL